MNEKLSLLGMAVMILLTSLTSATSCAKYSSSGGKANIAETAMPINKDERFDKGTRTSDGIRDTADVFSLKDLPCGREIPVERKYFDDCGVAKFNQDGSFFVFVNKIPLITNQTRGARLKLMPGCDSSCSGVLVQAEVRYSDIGSDSNDNYVGGKILCINPDFNATGFPAYYYPNKMLLGTDCQWRKISVFMPISSQDKKPVLVVFGMQKAWGTMEFRNTTITIIKNESKSHIPAVSSDFRCEYTARVTSMPTMRGVMSPVPALITQDDIRELGKWNVNLIRYQMVADLKDKKDIDAYEKWIDSCLDKLDSLMAVLDENKIKVVIDMHIPPGGRYKQLALLGTAGSEAAKLYGNGGRFLMTEEAEYRNAFLRIWKKIAKRYKDNQAIYGYDLVNEPDQRGATQFHYQDVLYDAALAIREIDSETPIIFEGNQWASPTDFDLPPIPLKNIIYEIHYYAPGDYTHQGVGNAYAKNYEKMRWDYRNQGWNKEKLRSVLDKVVAFQEKYHARIYVGEFSVTLWAPGGAQYLEDVIGIFEERKWDWSYHAFREWIGWSVEHSGTPQDIRPDPMSDRKKVLLKYFQKNNSNP